MSFFRLAILLFPFLLLLSACNSKEIDYKRERTSTINLQVENTIYNTLTSNETDENKIKKIFGNIYLLDWSIYSSVSSNNSMELLSFLERNFTNSDESGKINFFKATTKLDGAYAERYSSIVGDLFVKDKRSTINLISKLDTSKQKEIVDYILFNFSDKDKLIIKNDVNQLKELDIEPNERKVINLILAELK